MPTPKNNNLLYDVVALAMIAGVIALFYVAPPGGAGGGRGITGFATSQVGNLSAGVGTFISCTWSNEALAVSFGTSLNPGTNNINATNNYNGTNVHTLYNVTVDTLSNVNVNITMKGNHLISGANTIGVTNVTWHSNTTSPNSTDMIESNSIVLTDAYNTANPIAGNEAIGSTVWFRLWLDVPSGQIAGTYTGNFTQQCQQA